jgi:hypothetical protein
MRRSVIITIIIALAVVSQAKADCVQNNYGKVFCGEGQCLVDEFGRAFCAPVSGGIIRDMGGNLLCGVGHCVTNIKGQVWCSVIEDGDATSDMNGRVYCTGGCSRGNKQICQVARQPW